MIERRLERNRNATAATRLLITKLARIADNQCTACQRKQQRYVQSDDIDELLGLYEPVAVASPCAHSDSLQRRRVVAPARRRRLYQSMLNIRPLCRYVLRTVH